MDLGIPPHEPKRLVAVRILVILIITCSIMTPMNIMLEWSDRTNATHTGRNATLDPNMNIERLNFNRPTDELLNINYKSLEPTMGSGDIYLFRPDPSWVFTAGGDTNDNGASKETEGLRYFKQSTKRDTDRQTVPLQNLATVTFVENLNRMTKFRRINSDLVIKVTSWGHNEVNLKQVNVVGKHANGGPVKYSIQSTERSAGTENVGITVKPWNSSVDGNGLFNIEVQESKSNFSWFDCFGTVGGALTLSFYLYTFLFGQRRLRPWGIVQQYMFRERILNKFPRAVSEIYPPYILMRFSPPPPPPPPQPSSSSPLSRVRREMARHSWSPNPLHRDSITSNGTNADTLLETSVTINDPNINDSSNSMRKVEALEKKLLRRESEITLTSPEIVSPLPSFVGRMSMSSVMSSQHYNDLPPMEIRVSELEAFRQRAESFYMANDLFWKRGKNNPVRRGTLYPTINIHIGDGELH
ncbi:hypothetical protein BDF22DRAFT_666443 [Syncephalis plumigaleata]|nr:hypothetical protein BDF22DRAFT_666443 [Syncephalis plumigaleata]